VRACIIQVIFGLIAGLEALGVVPVKGLIQLGIGIEDTGEQVMLDGVARRMLSAFVVWRLALQASVEIGRRIRRTSVVGRAPSPAPDPPVRLVRP
jgi:hypothetical protein